MSQKSETTNTSTLQPESIRRIRSKIAKWGNRNYKHYPWRNPKEPWHGLVAEILLQRTKADTVTQVYETFTSHFTTPDDLGKASVKEIARIIYPLGLKWRAPLLKELGSNLASNDGEIPTDLELLNRLPGVGPYVSAAWLGFHGGKRSTIIDANIVRLICRITGNPYDGETRRKKWLIELAESLTPKRKWKEYNYSVLDFSMAVCTKKPKCNICPIGIELCKTGFLLLGKE
jgi:A/G-specific adenine glycosylase